MSFILELPRRNPFRWMFKSPHHFLLTLKWRLLSRKSDRKMLFVTGFGRSGTTLVQATLGAHPKCVAPPGEFALFHVGQDIFLRDRFANYFSEDELEELFRSSKDFADLADRFYNKLSRGNPDLWCVDKLGPLNIINLSYVLHFFPNARFVALSRDPRDVYCSARKHGGFPSSSDPARLGKAWRRASKCVLRLARRPGALSVRYEDLVADPEASLSRMMQLIGEDLDQAQLSGESRKYHKKHSDSRWQKLSGPIDPGSVGRWREELCREDVEAIQRSAWKEMQSLGYELV